MEDLLIHMFVVAPLIKWLTGKDRQWNKKSIYPGVVLAVLALGIIAFAQFQREEKNLYEVLGLSPSSSKAEVQASYRRLAVKLHPDKNPEPNAKEKFEKVKRAQEILSNDKFRKTYTRFGDFSKTGEINSSHFWDVLFVAIIQNIIPVFFGYLYTFGKASQAARKVFLCYVGMVFSLELLLRFGPDSEDAVSWLPGIGPLLPFEKVKALQGLVPIVLNGVLLLGATLHTDTEAMVEQVAIFGVQTNLDILARVDSITAQLAKLPLSTGNKKSTVSSPAPPPSSSSPHSHTNLGDSSLSTQTPQRCCKLDDEEESGAGEEEGRTVGDALSNEEVVEEDEWMKAVEPHDMMVPGGLELRSGLSTRRQCRDKRWLNSRGKQLQAFVTVRSAGSQRAGRVSLASAVFFGILFVRYYFS